MRPCLRNDRVEMHTAARSRHGDEAVVVPSAEPLRLAGLEFVDQSFAFDKAVVRYVQQRTATCSAAAPEGTAPPRCL